MCWILLGIWHVGFFIGTRIRDEFARKLKMNITNPTMAQQVATAANEFQGKLTGHNATSVTVVQSDGTLVVTLHGALSEGEKVLSKTPEGAVKVQEFYRQLFTKSCEPLRKEIKRITGVEVREATAQVETCTGTIVHAFTTGTMVQVFLLAREISPELWSAEGPDTKS